LSKKTKWKSVAMGGWDNPKSLKSIGTLGFNQYDLTGGSAAKKGQAYKAKGTAQPSGGAGGTDPNQNNSAGVTDQQAGTTDTTGANGEMIAQPTDQEKQAAVIASDPNPVLPVAEAPKYVIPRNIKEAQAQVIQRQNEIATGRNSISDLQFRRAMDDLAKSQSSAAASARGVSNQGLLNRNIAQSTHQMGLDMARESASAKLAEMRGADELLAAQAAAANGVSLQRSLADQAAATAKRGQDMQMMGNMASSAATIASSSDENSKTNIKEVKGESTKSVTEFMDALKSYVYEYKKDSKQPGGKPNPEGKVKSVMAQDLEKSDIGKQMVTDTPNGKVVDYAQGMAPLFAAIAELNERTKHLGKGK